MCLKLNLEIPCDRMKKSRGTIISCLLVDTAAYTFVPNLLTIVSRYVTYHISAKLLLLHSSHIICI